MSPRSASCGSDQPTGKSDFPVGWSEPVLALRGDVFEASHTYKLKGRSEYLTLIEAQGGGRRYYKAYLAQRLEGPWRGLADSLAKPFVACANLRQEPEWTASISHGEPLRAGVDQTMERWTRPGCDSCSGAPAARNSVPRATARFPGAWASCT